MTLVFVLDTKFWYSLVGNLQTPYYTRCKHVPRFVRACEFCHRFSLDKATFLGCDSDIVFSIDCDAITKQFPQIACPSFLPLRTKSLA